MRLTIQIPTSYFRLYLQHRLLAYRRTECSEDLPCLAVLGFTRSEVIAQKVKGSMLGVTLAVTILTIDYLGLLFVQFQSAVCKPLYQAYFQILRLLLCTAVTNGIVGKLISIHLSNTYVRNRLAKTGPITDP